MNELFEVTLTGGLSAARQWFQESSDDKLAAFVNEAVETVRDRDILAAAFTHVYDHPGEFCNNCGTGLEEKALAVAQDIKKCI